MNLQAVFQYCQLEWEPLPDKSAATYAIMAIAAVWAQFELSFFN
jgi:hypothetical protein